MRREGLRRRPVEGALGAAPALLTSIVDGPERGARRRRAPRRSPAPRSRRTSIDDGEAGPLPEPRQRPPAAAPRGGRRALTRAPARRGAGAMAAPMPLPAPVTSAWRRARASIAAHAPRRRAGAREVGLVLLLGGEILLRPGHVGHPIFAASCKVQAGSARCGRAMAQRSARPAAMIELAWSASEIAPTAMRRRCRPRCGSCRRTASGTGGHRPAARPSTPGPRSNR